MIFLNENQGVHIRAYNIYIYIYIYIYTYIIPTFYALFK